jgi:hypothetical protein
MRRRRQALLDSPAAPTPALVIVDDLDPDSVHAAQQLLRTVTGADTVEA